MRTIDPPAIDEADLYDRLKGKRAADAADTLTRARTMVLGAYATYTTGQVWALNTVIQEDGVADHLRANYPVLRSGALSTTGAMFLARSGICCLCGLRDTSELDHYLPKEDFSEFAAYSVNLIPVCGVCNKKKGRKYKTDGGGPAFVHAYQDRLPDSLRFLKATLDFGGGVAPSFEVVQPPGMSKRLFETLAAQFKHFKLQAAYSDAAIELLVDKFVAIEEYFCDGGASAVQKYLDRDARSAINNVGANNWRPVTLAAAASSAEFCAGGYRQLTS